MENKKNKKKLIKWGAIIGSAAFLLIGILAIVIGYAIKDGWASVGAWFVSRWAIYIYIAIVIIIFIAIWFFHKKRMEK